MLGARCDVLYGSQGPRSGLGPGRVTKDFADPRQHQAVLTLARVVPQLGNDGTGRVRVVAGVEIDGAELLNHAIEHDLRREVPIRSF